MEVEAEAFYCGLLGLVVLAKPPSHARRGGRWFERPGGRLQLHVGVEKDFRPARKAHPALLVDDFDGLVADLAHAGIAVRHDDEIPGSRRCYLDDPFGNRIELIELTPSETGEGDLPRAL